MRTWFLICGAAMVLVLLPVMTAATPRETLGNEKVRVVERTLAPGETFSFSREHASVVVYLDAGTVTSHSGGSSPANATVRRGAAEFLPPGVGTVINRGAAEMRLVRVEYLGTGGDVTWGSVGLAPDYRVLFENRFGRVYNIVMRAHHDEPLHSHHDRVVICLSGATLLHEMPDGRKEPSTLKTGEIAWRRGGIHIGHNLGDTDLWVIAIEPK